MSKIQNHLINEYKKIIKLKLKKTNQKESLCSVNTQNLSEYLFNVYKGLWNHLKITEKSFYESRQELLNAIYLTKNKDVYFHINPIEASSTMMGGSSEKDPYYDCNWKMYSYNIDNQIYSRITNNLKARFFVGNRCEWQAFNNKRDYLFSLDFENISIEEFNSLFSLSYYNTFEEFITTTDFNERMLKLISFVFCIEDFEHDLYKKEHKDSNKEPFKYIALHNSIFFDEIGRQLNREEIHNASFSKSICKNDIIFVNNNLMKVKDIKIKGHLSEHFYTEVYLMPIEDKENIILLN